MSPILTISLLPGSGIPGQLHKALATTDPDNSSFAALLWMDGMPPLPLPDSTALPLPPFLKPRDSGDEGTALPSVAVPKHHATPALITTQLPAAITAALPAPASPGKTRPTLPDVVQHDSQRPAAVPVYTPPPASTAPSPPPANVAALPALLPSIPKPAAPPEIPVPYIHTGHVVPDNPLPAGDHTLPDQDSPARPDITFWAQPALRSAELTLDADGHAVQVKVALSGSQGNEAHVTLLTDHAAERQALHGETGQLRDMLHEEGLHLAAVTVGSGERQHSRQPYPYDLPKGARQRATLPAEAEHAAVLQQRMASVVDVFV